MDTLILGGTGVISGAVVDEMLGRGVAVTMVTRGQRARVAPRGVVWIRKDRQDTEGLAALLAGKKFDAVIDTISYTAEDARQTVSLFRDRAAQILILSSVAAYKRPFRSLPTREGEEALWDDPVYPYAYRKALMETYLAEASAEGVPVTVVRPSLTYGPGSRNVGVLRQNYGILTRIRSGKPLVMSGDGTTPWSFSFAPDVARAIVDLLGKTGAIGGTFHVASQERTVWSDLYRVLGQIVGREPLLVHIPSHTLYRALPDLCGHLYFEKSHPGLFDDTHLRRVVPGFRTRIGLADGLRTLIDTWNREGLQPDPLRDLLEDRLVEAARAGATAVRNAATDERS